MSADVVTAVSDWPARSFAALAFVGGALLVAAATPWAAAFGLNDGPRWFCLALTVTTVVCLAISSVKGGAQLLARRRARAPARANGRAFAHEMRTLTADERAVLASFMAHGARTAQFSYTDSMSGLARTAHALAVRGHLYQLTHARNLWFSTVSYGIQEPMFAFLQRHPEVLGDLPGGRGQARQTPAAPDPAGAT